MTAEYVRNLPPVRHTTRRRSYDALGAWVVLLVAAECAATAALILAAT